MEIELTPEAEKDLEKLPDEVQETFFSKLEAIEKNMGIGASPSQAFDKYLSGNMHPALQINLGRNHRAWFIESKYLPESKEEKVYCVKILSKESSLKLTEKIKDFVSFVENLS